MCYSDRRLELRSPNPKPQTLNPKPRSEIKSRRRGGRNPSRLGFFAESKPPSPISALSEVSGVEICLSSWIQVAQDAKPRIQCRLQQPIKHFPP